MSLYLPKGEVILSLLLSPRMEYITSSQPLKPALFQLYQSSINAQDFYSFEKKEWHAILFYNIPSGLQSIHKPWKSYASDDKGRSLRYTRYQVPGKWKTLKNITGDVWNRTTEIANALPVDRSQHEAGIGVYTDGNLVSMILRSDWTKKVAVSTRIQAASLEAINMRRCNWPASGR